MTPNTAQQFLKKLIMKNLELRLAVDCPILTLYVSLSHLPNEAGLSLQKEQQHNQHSDK